MHIVMDGYINRLRASKEARSESRVEIETREYLCERFLFFSLLCLKKVITKTQCSMGLKSIKHKRLKISLNCTLNNRC